MFSWLGHVKWFIDGSLPATAPINLMELQLLGAALMVFLSILIITDQLWKAINIDNAIDKKIKSLSKWVPLIVRLSTGLMILVNLLAGDLFSPNLPLNGNFLVSLIGTILFVCAVLMISGVAVHAAGGLLVIGYLFSFVTVDTPLDLLDHVIYVGLGFYMLAIGGGPGSIGHKELFKSLPKTWVKSAPRILIAMGGLTLISMSLGEKLLNFPVALNFLTEHDWNLLSKYLITDRLFIVIIGAAELTMGLGLLINRAVRPILVVLLLIMICTALKLGVGEIYGHLFAVSMLVVGWLLPVHDQTSRLQKLPIYVMRVVKDQKAKTGQ